MIKFFVKKHMAVFSFAVLIVIMGILAYAGLPRESVPELKQPYIFITTIYTGVSAKDIESLVTDKIEKELDGLNGVKEITSSSQQSFSSIFVEFTSDVTVDIALQRVKDRVDIAKPELPEDAEEPTVKEFSSSDWPVFVVAMSNPDGVEVLDKISEDLEDELERIPGVLEVDIAGNLTRELAIELDPEKLEHYGFAIGDVIDAINSENTSIPGGILKNQAKNYSLSVTGEIKDPKAFEEIIINVEGVKVKLREIGTAKFQFAEPETYTRFNKNPAITLAIKKRIGANIIDMGIGLKKVIEKYKKIMPENSELEISYDESNAIKDMIADLENNMFSGFVLVLLVTIMFLGRRNSLFVSLAIPLSMLMSFFIIQMLGITLNMIVLFSLILALGMLVDNGIVIVENIFRHGSMGKNRRDAAIDGSKEVAGPIIASTVTTCLAFFPIIFMPGVMGDFMSYLPKTVIIVLSSSLLVALIINPAFCASFLKVSEEDKKKMIEGSGIFAKFQSGYLKILHTATAKPRRTLWVSFIIVITGMVLYGAIGKETVFFPYLDPERARVTIELPQGTPLEQTDEFLKKIENIVGDAPASLKSFEAKAGTDSEDTASHKAVIDITYNSYNIRKKEVKGATAIKELKRLVKNIPGADIKVEEAEDGPPTGADVSYQVIGTDYAVMGELSKQVLDILKEYSEFKETDSDYESSKPEFEVKIDREKAAFHGLSTVQIASTVRNAMNGSTIGSFKKDEEEYDIVIRYKDEARNSINRLKNLQIITNNGNRIPLSSVAGIIPKTTTGIIKRRDLKRSVEVWANFEENTANKAIIKQEIENKVKNISMPNGYYLDTGSGADERTESTAFLGQAFLVALFLIFIVLIAQFNSVSDPFIIMFSVFLSLGGVFWGFLLTGMSFIIIMSGIGCISLAGVAVNNCIVLVDYTNILMKQGMYWKDAILESGKTRLRPVILTALTTVLALIPMAFGVSFDVHTFTLQIGSESGEWWKSFAWTMLYGLSFATVMTLVVVPSSLTLKYSKREKKIKKREQKLAKKKEKSS